MNKTEKDMFEIWRSKKYAERVTALEAEGLTTSDAQGVADAEFMQGGTK